tara:strand:+ start:570 stop:1487 length:918 start_codon:yes stop_codon:yes gene_type:complete
MKSLESTFENYVRNKNKCDIHEYVSPIDKLQNLIIYGARGTGKYTQALKLIEPFSPSKLKYEKKFSFIYNKEEYRFPISDIHMEVDIGMLGCASKLLWHEVYKNYIDVILSKKDKTGIILCKNFDDVHIELNDIFHSYMINYQDNYSLYFIILTENVSFIQNEILSICNIINLSKSSKNLILKVNKMNMDESDHNYDLNSLHCYDNDIHSKICDKIINYIIDIDNFKVNEFREILYELLVYNIKISSSIWYILKNILKDKKYSKHITKVIQKTASFFHLYNNNYRPIYHLENFFVYLINTIHELE